MTKRDSQVTADLRVKKLIYNSGTTSPSDQANAISNSIRNINSVHAEMLMIASFPSNIPIPPL